jgi:hypothetical protein
VGDAETLATLSTITILLEQISPIQEEQDGGTHSLGTEKKMGTMKILPLVGLR